MNNDNDLSRHSSATAGDSVRSFERDVLPLAEDLVQETLLKAYTAFDKLRLETHFRAWLLCIMRNTWINNHRADPRRPVKTLVGDIAETRLRGAAPLGTRALRRTSSPSPRVGPRVGRGVTHLVIGHARNRLLRSHSRHDVPRSDRAHGCAGRHRPITNAPHPDQLAPVTGHGCARP